MTKYIKTLVTQLKLSNLSVVSFRWVCRDANYVAHSLANFASTQPVFLSCNVANLSLSIHEASIRDLFSLSF
jgi:hypothetical protein